MTAFQAQLLVSLSLSVNNLSSFPVCKSSGEDLLNDKHEKRNSISRLIFNSRSWSTRDSETMIVVAYIHFQGLEIDFSSRLRRFTYFISLEFPNIF